MIWSFRVYYPTTSTKGATKGVTSLPRELFHKGVSFNIIYFTWAIWGGFLLHMLLSNYLPVLLKPVYDKPLDTTQVMSSAYVNMQANFKKDDYIVSS